jgi:hypothetical protein
VKAALVSATVRAMDRSTGQAQAFQQEKESYRRSIGDTVQRTFPAYSKSQHLQHVLKLIEGLRQISDSPQQHSESEIIGFCHELEYHLGATSDKRFLDPGSDSEKELASILLTLLLSPFIGPLALPSVCSLILCDQVIVKHCGVQLDWRKTMYRLQIIMGQELKQNKTALSQLKSSTSQTNEFVRVIGKICRLFPPQAFGELAQVLVGRHAQELHQWILYYALQKCPYGSFDWRPFVKFLAETPPYNPNGTFIIARILRRNCIAPTPLLPSDSLISSLFNFVFFSLDSIGPNASSSSGVVTKSSRHFWTELEIVLHLCALCPDKAIPQTLQLFDRLELFVHPNSNTRCSNIDSLLLKIPDHIYENTMRVVRKTKNSSKFFLAPHHYDALVTPIVRIVFNALLHENTSVRSLAISSIKCMLLMGSPSCVIDLIDVRVRAVFSDLGLTASHHTPMVIHLAISILPSILNAAHPSYPFTINSQHATDGVNTALRRLAEMHGYDTNSSALNAQRRAVFVASDPGASHAAHRRATGLLLLPFILSQLLEQLCASDISISNAVLEFYEAFCLMVPLFPLPLDAVPCSDISEEVWSAIVTVSHSLQDWACAVFEKLLYMVDHMLDSENDHSSATADSKKVGSTMIALVNSLPEKGWATGSEYDLTRQSAHAKIIHIVKTSMNWKQSKSRMLLIRVLFNTNPEKSAMSSLIHTLADRIVIRNGRGTPSAESDDFSAIVGLPEGVKFVSLSPEELAYNVWLLWQCFASCRCTAVLSEKLKGESPVEKIFLAVHCMLLLHNESLASLPNFRDFALHRDLFTHSLHLMKASMEVLSGMFESGTSNEYCMVPPSQWNDSHWRRLSYMSWGRGISTAHASMEPSTVTEMTPELHAAISMNLMAPLEILAAESSELSDKILEKHLMMARQSLSVLMPFWHIVAHDQRQEHALKPEFQVGVPFAWQVTLRSLRHTFCHYKITVPTPNPFPEIGAVAALFTQVLEKVSRRALKDNSVTIAASVLSLAEYWCHNVTEYTAASNIIGDSIHVNERWVRKYFLSNVESASSALMKYANYARCTVFEFSVAKTMLPLLFHSIASVRSAAIAALGKVMSAHPRLISEYLFDLVMPVATDLTSGEHAFAGCILFFENASVQKLYNESALKRTETVQMIILNQERVLDDPLILNQYLYFAAYSFVDAITPCYPQALSAAAAEGDAAAIAFLQNPVDSTNALQLIVDAYADKEIHWKFKECGFRLFEALRLAGHHVNSNVFEALLKEACSMQLGASMFITEIETYSLGVHSLVTQSINGVVSAVRNTFRTASVGGLENAMMESRIGYHDREFTPVSTANAADVEALRLKRSASRRTFVGETTPNFSSPDDRKIIDCLRSFLQDRDRFASLAKTRSLNCSSNADQSTADLNQFQNNQELEAHVADEYITFFRLLTSLFGRLVLHSAKLHIEEAFQLFCDTDPSGRRHSVVQRDLMRDNLPQVVFAIEAVVGILAGTKHLPQDETDFICKELEPQLQMYLEGLSGLDQLDFEWMEALQDLGARINPASLDWLLSAMLKPILQCSTESASISLTTHVLCRRLKFAYTLASTMSCGPSATLEQFVAVAHLFSSHSSSLVRERVSKLVGISLCYRYALARSMLDIVAGYDGHVICDSTWKCFINYFEHISQQLKIVEDRIAAQRHTKPSVHLLNEADPIEHTVVVLVKELEDRAQGQVVGFAVPALLNALFRLSAIRDQDYAEVRPWFGATVCVNVVFALYSFFCRSTSCHLLHKCPGPATCRVCRLKPRPTHSTAALLSVQAPNFG